MNSTMSSVGRTSVKPGADEERNSRASRDHDVGGLEAILDYAIVEGTQMGFSFFVSLLRLARMALNEEREKAAKRAAQPHSS